MHQLVIREVVNARHNELLDDAARARRVARAGHVGPRRRWRRRAGRRLVRLGEALEGRTARARAV